MARERSVAARKTTVKDGEVMAGTRHIARPELVKEPIFPLRRSVNLYNEAEAAISLTYYGPFGRKNFPHLAEREEIWQKFGDPANTTGRQKRRAMFETYQDLTGRMAKVENLGDFFGMVEAVDGIMHYMPAYTANLEHHKDLDKHLDGVRDTLAAILLNADGTSRYEDLISTRDAQLLTYVAGPMHDKLKPIGPETAQTILDHQAIAAACIRDHFVGKKVRLHNGSLELLSQDDVDFVAQVVGNHENIADVIADVPVWQTENTRVKNALEFFLIADTLTKVFEPKPEEGNNTFSINQEMLNTRFEDLFVRHLDASRKIFMPEWGVKTIEQLLNSFAVMKSLRDDLTISGPNGESIEEALVGAGIEAINKVDQAGLTKNEKKRIKAAMKKLNELGPVKSKASN